MLKQYDPQTARQTILKRSPPDEFPVSQRVLDGIAELFGERLSPEAAVTRILKDVRTSDDSALQKWTLTLDGLDLKPAPVSKAAIQSALDSISPAQREALELAAARVEAFGAIDLSSARPARLGAPSGGAASASSGLCVRAC